MELTLAAANQARLDALVESSSAAIISMDMEGTITHWNPAAARLFGYLASEMLGASRRILSPRERLDEFDNFVARLLRDEMVQDFETQRLHKDGTRIDVAITASIVRDEQNSPYGLNYVIVDIRERKRLAQRLAEIVDQERHTLARDLHDSLSQQCATCGLLAASLAAQLDPDSPYAELAQKLVATTDQAKVHVRLITRGLFPVAVEPQGLRIALEELAQQATQLHHIECSFECHETFELAESVVATQLFLIAREAVHNALKHARANKIVIQLNDENGITLSVRDNGQGMTLEQAESQGMGLQIMRYRARLAGGLLRLESSRQGGTIVTCFVPEGRATGCKIAP